ncbi:alpha/beta hydrolase [Microbispora sp. ZYX-F-249]|uniref:Alpha/beta hydrolase n=1 Tax=Microbispora maris TaxID=3144104 RepID=A0ABV0ARZ0_9ACTN
MSFPRSRLRALSLAALTAVAIAAPAAAAPVQAADAGAVAGTVPPGLRGTPLSARPLTGAAALPSAARDWYVTYVSEGASGERVTVSGVVSVPATPPPPGGWPVISWAHGTTGTADVCAPSADTADGPAHGYLASVNPTLDAWVAHGFAVVRTDYEGLGTPGGHPYMNGRSAAASVIDMVRAARRVDPRIGRDWFAAGHSQGGHAALFTAAATGERGDVRLRGAIAVAPGGWGYSQTVAYLRAMPGAKDALAFLPTILLGAAAADPAIRPEELVTDEVRPLLDAARTGCMDQVRAVAADTNVSSVFRPGADTGTLTGYLRAQEPAGLKVRVPTLVAQGTADVLVPKQTTDLMVADLCAGAAKVTYRTYAGADHRASVAASFDDALAFARTILAGGTPAPTC